MSEKVVLVVDDHEDARRILSVLLRHRGYGVLTAEDVQEGLRLAELHRPDLILLDIMMPEVNSLAAIKDLRRSEKTGATPIMVVTAKEEPGLRERIRGEGFCAYLKKPFFPSEAMDAIERCLDERSVEEGWVDLPNYPSLRPPTI